MKKTLSIVIIILIFQNCNSININKTQSNDQKNNKQNFFRFLTDDLKGEDLREKYICMFPTFVNIEFSKDTSNIFKQKYPNPCSPSMYRNFIMYIEKPKSYFQINILNSSDSVISTFIPQNLKKGYFAFYSEHYVKYNKNDFETFKGTLIMSIRYSVVFILDDRKYKFNLTYFG